MAADESDVRADGRASIRVADPAVRALLPRYLERRRADVLRMTELLADERYAEIRVLAHNMRGSGTAYGIEFVTRIGTVIEGAARAADGATIADAIRELETLLDSATIE